MKPNRVLIVALFSFFCLSLSAQVFVGGNIRFNTSGGKNDDGTTVTNKPSNYTFDLTPKVGKFFSENFAAGIALDLSFSGSKSTFNAEITNRTSTIGVSPFLRYYAVNWNKFSVFGQGNIGLEFSRSTIKTDGTITDEQKGSRSYVNIFPGLSYDISDRLSLETTLNLFSIGYSYSTTKDGPSKDTSSGFNMGAGLDNIATLGNITIGAIYKF